MHFNQEEGELALYKKILKGFKSALIFVMIFNILVLWYFWKRVGSYKAVKLKET